MPAYFAAILRMLIGAGFLWLGIRKLFDADLLYGGLMRRIEQQGTPFPLYGEFLLRYVELNQDAFVLAVAISEIAVGASLLLGLLVSLGAVGGAFLALNVALATTYGDMPAMALYLCASAVLLLLGRGAAGLTWGLDGWLTSHINDAVILFPLRRRAPEAKSARAAASPLRARTPSSTKPATGPGIRR
jgi:uncharacterized membrane protein YphA (DoxX/SURF4 family)